MQRLYKTFGLMKWMLMYVDYDITLFIQLFLNYTSSLYIKTPLIYIICINIIISSYKYVKRCLKATQEINIQNFRFISISSHFLNCSNIIYKFLSLTQDKKTGYRECTHTYNFSSLYLLSRLFKMGYYFDQYYLNVSFPKSDGNWTCTQC